MRGGNVREAALEARRVVQTIRGELEPVSTGAIVVSGMLAEQLVRELARDAEPGAVVVGDGTSVAQAAVAIHILAAEPSGEDQALVRTADNLGVPVVLVQLWPQADWTPPFVLTPFVVECRAGAGFPIDEIASRTFEASANEHELARRIPVLRDAVARAIVRRSVARAGIIGALGRRLGPSRPLLVLEQARMLTRLRSVESGSGELELAPTIAAVAGTTLGLGLALRGVTRTVRHVLPRPLADAAVAAAGTWVLGRAMRELGHRF